jgi:hypothetical protein
MNCVIFFMFQLSEAVIETLWTHGSYQCRFPHVVRKGPATLGPSVFARKKILDVQACRSKDAVGANPPILDNEMLRLSVLCKKIFLRRLRGGVGVNHSLRQKIRRAGFCQAIEGCSVRASFGRSRNSVPTLCRTHKVLAYFNLVSCGCHSQAVFRCLAT